MRTPNKILLALLVLGLAGFTPDRDRDRDRGTSRTATPSAPEMGHGGADGPTPGSCELGDASRDLDVNRVQARAFNTGSLFFGGTSEAVYLVPKASGKSAIFASGIWIGGEVGGELRGAGSTYANFEFWPGPLDPSTARPVNPSNCEPFDRIWKVSQSDILDIEAGADINEARFDDLREWPWELGAPVLAAPNNGIDDDGDGLVDEGTDGIDNDGDGLIDERDEQERRTDGYDFAAGDRPELIGDQALWWVMNDVGNTHDEWGTPPIGVEVRVQMFSFDRDNALGDVTFYKYTVIYYGDEPFEEVYLSVFSDPDLGDAVDDYVGSDTTLSLGYVYNADNVDGGSLGYGVAPPAVGYDFFQGPVVDGDTLGLTRFSYFINGGPPGTLDPANSTEYYNIMNGVWTNGLPMVECSIGINCAGAVTKFAFPGDPVDRTGWNELSANNTPGDRRFVVTTGPFTMQPGDSQDIVFGIVFGQGNSNISSISALRAADIVAQSAYDADFEVPEPPPAPAECEAGNPRLQPGSGNCLEAVEGDRELTLVWGYPETSSNYLGQFNNLGYEFEGFNVYQYPDSDFSQGERVLVATFDEVNGIFQVNNLVFDINVGDLVEQPAARGTDSGIQYFYQPETDIFTGQPLINYRDYYFSVSAYAVNQDAPLERVVESSPTTLTVRPSSIASSAGGSFTQATVGQVLAAERIAGEGLGLASAIVVDPTQITGASYTVEVVVLEDFVVDGAPLITYRVLRGGDVVFDGEERAEQDGIYIPIQPITDLAQVEAIEDATGLDVFTGQIVIDGLQFVNAFAPGLPEDADFLPDFSGDGEGVIEVANPNIDDVCGGPLAAADPGCANFPGNTVWHDPNATGDYYISTGSDGSLAALGRFIEKGVPDDFEIRFTDEGGYAVYGFVAAPFPIATVPFEIWNVGDVDDPNDDIRMIPFLNANVAPLSDWENEFPATDPWAGSPCDGGCPITDWVYWMMPDRPNGYELFEDAAIAFGGAGALYDPTADGDNMPSPDLFNGGDCPTDGVYVNYCYRNDVPAGQYPGSAQGGAFVYPVGRMVFADLAQDGTTPETGVVVRIITTPKGELLVAGDAFRFDTSALVLVTGDDPTAQEALEAIGIVPNPYFGASLYESGSLDRRVRFVNLPPQATIRIYTVAGSLIRELSKDGPSRSLDWDLTTFGSLPVASGMYLIHVEARDEDGAEIGERILKFGVINRQIDVDVF